MKAGIVMALAAVKILKEAGLEPSIRLLLNSEEEVGSPVSRPITEDLARSAESGLCTGTRAGAGLQDLAERCGALPH